MPAARTRVDWVDYAKGFCIVMVVMMHSTLGVEKAADQQGWMHYLVAFAAPFRMPDFFLIAGLFLNRVIDRPWSVYLDRKVVHFAYFYILWVTIQFVFKAPGMVAEGGIGAAVQAYLMAYVEPFGTMWFIYMLPIMFMITRLLGPLPWQLVWLSAAVLETFRLNTGWILLDEFAARYVYFFSGYIFAAHIFTIADHASKNTLATSVFLVVWALVNGAAVFGGISQTPVISLALGFLGALAIIAIAVLMARVRWFELLRYAGEHSLVVYLAFFLPMAATRTALLRTGIIPDIGTVSLLVTCAAVLLPLVFYVLVRKTSARFLFERPDWATIDRAESRITAQT